MKPHAPPSAPPPIPSAGRASGARWTMDLPERYRAIRETTLRLVAPLSVEDASAQSMADASPAKWHLAHTTWFMETFVLTAQRDFTAFDPSFRTLFNSYYNAVGPQHPRARRGLLTRPSLHQVLDYRAHVDAAMTRALEDGALDDELLGVVVLGLHHEQQHQELILMDVKHLFSCNPIAPAYAAPSERAPAGTASPLRWIACAGGLVTIGAAAGGFSFDNERPHHRVHLEPFAIASRLVTNGEFLAFVRDGGYRRADLWQSDGWEAAGREGWDGPLYWRERDGAPLEFTLAGERPLVPEEPVCHVSWYEADAYARWAGARLPDEAERESAAAAREIEGNFLESGSRHPSPAVAPDDAARAADQRPLQVFGDAWEWTRSAYGPYPGYHPPAGAIGEYNGKFMVNQMVLRGGSCATPASHIRASYRNFFYPANRWQFGGIRLARDAR